MSKHEFSRPRWYRRIWFWSTDGQYEVTEWLETRLGRGLPKLWEWQEELIGKPISWVGCKVFGHHPISDCHVPEHDFCAYCRKSMPGQAPRSPTTSQAAAETASEDG